MMAAVKRPPRVLFSRRSSPRASLLLALVAVVGCAHLGSIPPAPPLAVPIPGSPREYTWNFPKWQPGTKLTYNAQIFAETRAGNDIDTRTSHHVFRLTGIERTAKGAVRVQLAIDKQELGYFLQDEGGLVTDAGASTPELAEQFKLFARLFSHPVVKQFSAKVLSLNERHHVEIPVADVLGEWTATSGHYFGATVAVDFEFTGYKALEGKRVAEFRSVVPNILRSSITAPIPKSRETIEIDNISGESIEYIDPASGFYVAKYEIIILSGQFRGQRWVRREIMAGTLDVRNSSGM